MSSGELSAIISPQIFASALFVLSSLSGTFIKHVLGLHPLYLLSSPLSSPFMSLRAAFWVISHYYLLLC